MLMCDHTYCYTPAVQRIRELLHSGVLGELQFVDSVRINLGLVQRDVNVLWDLAPHDLSILDFILPDGCTPLAVAAHGADPIGAGQACVAYLTLQLPRGAIAHVHVNWLSPIKVRTTTIGGSNRTLVWDDLNPSQRIAVYDRGVDLADPAGLDADDRRQAIVSYRSGDMVAPALPESEALQGVMAEFARLHPLRPRQPHRRPLRPARARHPRGGVAEPGVPRLCRAAARRPVDAGRAPRSKASVEHPRRTADIPAVGLGVGPFLVPAPRAAALLPRRSTVAAHAHAERGARGLPAAVG